MLRFARVAALAVLSAGVLLSAAVSARAGLDPLADRLTRDPNACWELQKVGPKGWETDKRLISNADIRWFFEGPLGPGSPDIEYEGDLNTPSETYIIIVHKPTNSYYTRYHRVPCPQPSSFSGLSGGVSLEKSLLFLTWVESLAATGATTNQNSVRGDPLGVGGNVGYGFRPWSGTNNIVVEPFLSFSYPNAKANYAFPGGSFIGARSNYEGTAGVKIGPASDFAWIYAIAGASLLNETLTVNFVPTSSTVDKTVSGATFGLGGAIEPGWLQIFGLPTSLSLEWQHTWWQTATFNTPASSPFFNYAYKRQDDRILLGVNFYLSR